MEEQKIICSKCLKSLKPIAFYTYKDGQKMSMCKDCLTMHIDNFVPKTFLHILQDLDMPYIEGEWNSLRDRAFAKNPNLNGKSVIGKYISKMKLKQYADYTWADTERIKIENEEKTKRAKADFLAHEEKIKEMYENGEIDEAEYKTMTSTSVLNQQYLDEQMAALGNPGALIGNDNFFMEEDYINEEELIDPSLDLTKEDKVYLATKWGRLYKPSEWLILEQTYDDFMESFDIKGAARIDTLKKICKTSLKMDLAINQE